MLALLAALASSGEKLDVEPAFAALAEDGYLTYDGTLSSLGGGGASAGGSASLGSASVGTPGAAPAAAGGGGGGAATEASEYSRLALAPGCSARDEMVSNTLAPSSRTSLAHRLPS